MTKHFVPLHIHTEYSLLDGAIKIKDLLNFAKAQDWKAVGISDHGNIFGAVNFFQKAKKENIKPILGTELYFSPDATIKNQNDKYYHILLIVQNKKGYENLCRLMAYAYQEGFYFKPRIDLKTLEKFNEGLIVGTACIGGYVPKLLRKGRIEEGEKAIEWFLNIFGRDRFYFEIMPPDIEKIAVTNKLLLEYSQKYDIKCIATTDSHYMKPQDYEAHEVLLAIQTKKQITDSGRMSFGDIKAYLQTTDEMLEIFKDNEQIVWNTGELADKCEFEFEFGKLFFPTAPIPQEFTEEEYFQKICIDGLKDLKEKDLIPNDQYQIYDDRLKLEMDLIIKMGFVGYFLIVSDFIKWAKKQNIPVGPGRGSAAGSLVAWAMEITNVDPIKYNLLFERFLNPERISMPDIDIDFCIEGREEVIKHVKEKYGHDCVCQIITFGTMMAKGVIKDVARVLGFPFQDSNALTDLVPDQLGISLKDAIEQEPRLQEAINNNPKIKQLFDISFKLEGLTRHASKHAAGIVISPKPLREVLPLYVPSKGTDLVAQYSMVDLESVGFLKMDFLGLKNLTVIQQSLNYIKKNHGTEIDLDKLPLDDNNAFELLKKGKTNGIFQLESDGLKEVLRKLQPEKFEDIIAVNALYRPGPLGSGMVDDFIDRRHGRKKVTYLFDELEPILAETYGVIVYQEQVMKIASAIAGYSLGQADILRRAMGKKKVEVMKLQKEQFLHGAKEKNFNEKKAAELFDLMAYFAGYGFNKSHSTAYALIAYQTAYLKSNYPAEFMAALTSFETNDPDKLSFYLQEISEMNLEILPPNINTSEIEFSPPEKNKVLFGLKGIKNAGLIALENIITQRKEKPFLDLLDFCKRVDLRTCNKRVIENLVYAGALDSLPGNRAQKINELEKIIDLANQAKKEEKTGQMSMFGFGNTKNEIVPQQYYEFAPLADWSSKEKLEKEKEAAGFYLSSHPLKSYKVLRWLKTSTFAASLDILKNPPQTQKIESTTIGLIQNYKEITTKKGDRMAFAQFEDLTGHSEVILFPRTYAKVSDLLSQHDVFIIKGNLDLTSSDKCKIIANELIPLENLFENTKNINNLNLELPSNLDESALTKIKESFHHGNIPISFNFNENGKNLILQTNQKITVNQESLKNLEQIGIKIQLSV
ncbi:MAG: DNA polymerase III subunit alpha [bacterium]